MGRTKQQKPQKRDRDKVRLYVRVFSDTMALVAEVQKRHPSVWSKRATWSTLRCYCGPGQT
jgi:hypothetical protein